MRYTIRNCDNCGRKYRADNRNLKRGWGLTCSKSCVCDFLKNPNIMGQIRRSKNYFRKRREKQNFLFFICNCVKR